MLSQPGFPMMYLSNVAYYNIIYSWSRNSLHSLRSKIIANFEIFAGNREF